MSWHNDPTEELIADLRRGYTAKGFEAWPCPGCRWERGQLLEECGLHSQIADLRRQLAEKDAIISKKGREILDETVIKTTTISFRWR